MVEFGRGQVEFMTEFVERQRQQRAEEPEARVLHFNVGGSPFCVSTQVCKTVGGRTSCSQAFLVSVTEPAERPGGLFECCC